MTVEAATLKRRLLARGSPVHVLHLVALQKVQFALHQGVPGLETLNQWVYISASRAASTGIPAKLSTGGTRDEINLPALL